MAGSTLTVRTLALATVALVLACGHAVKAMGDQRTAADRAVSRIAPSVAPIRVIPAGSGHSTVATFSNTGRGGGSGSSHVATFSASGGSSSSTIVTFGGDRVERRATTTTNTARRPQPGTAARGKPKGGILANKSEASVIAVRYADGSQAPADAPAPAAPTEPAPFVGPPAPEPVTLSAAPKTKPALRNAFAGISSSRTTIEPTANASQVYAHATAK